MSEELGYRERRITADMLTNLMNTWNSKRITSDPSAILDRRLSWATA